MCSCPNNIYQKEPDYVIVQRNVSNDDFKTVLQNMNLELVKQKHVKKIKLVKPNLEISYLELLRTLCTAIPNQILFPWPMQMRRRSRKQQEKNQTLS